MSSDGNKIAPAIRQYVQSDDTGSEVVYITTVGTKVASHSTRLYTYNNGVWSVKDMTSPEESDLDEYAKEEELTDVKESYFHTLEQSEDGTTVKFYADDDKTILLGTLTIPSGSGASADEIATAVAAYMTAHPVTDTNTTYTLSLSGTTLTLTDSAGKKQTVTLPTSGSGGTDTNTTYELSITDHTITLTGSDGSKESVTVPDNDTKGVQSVTLEGTTLSVVGADGLGTDYELPAQGITVAYLTQVLKSYLESTTAEATYQKILTDDDKQAIADKHQDAVTSVNGLTGDVVIETGSASGWTTTQINTLCDNMLKCASSDENWTETIESMRTLLLTGASSDDDSGDEEEETVAVTGITLSAESGSVEVGSEVTITATVSPEDATDKTVTWSSSDETVATVSGGTITTLKAGSATITATAGSYSATYALTVTEATSGGDDSGVTGEEVTDEDGNVYVDISQIVIDAMHQGYNIGNGGDDVVNGLDENADSWYTDIIDLSAYSKIMLYNANNDWTLTQRPDFWAYPENKRYGGVLLTGTTDGNQSASYDLTGHKFVSANFGTNTTSYNMTVNGNWEYRAYK